MFIHEATALAVSSGRFIRRADSFWAGMKIKPTDTPDCCVIVHENKRQASRPRWEPQAEDLLAGDWLVVD